MYPALVYDERLGLVLDQFRYFTFVIVGALNYYDSTTT